MYFFINPTLKDLSILDMCSIPRAVVTQQHQLGNLKQQDFFLEFWRLEMENQGVGSAGSDC